jgi:hypothetical protein
MCASLASVFVGSDGGLKKYSATQRVTEHQQNRRRGTFVPAGADQLLIITSIASKA